MARSTAIENLVTMADTDIIAFSEFMRVDMRVGTILSASPNVHARKPAYVMTIDFGVLGVKQSSAQITGAYTVDELPGRQVIAVLNFEPKRVAGVKSEVLVLAAEDGAGRLILVAPAVPVDNGARIL